MILMGQVKVMHLWLGAMRLISQLEFLMETLVTPCYNFHESAGKMMLLCENGNVNSI